MYDVVNCTEDFVYNRRDLIANLLVSKPDDNV